MWNHKRGAADFSSEIRSHLDHEVARLIADGMPPEAARLAARKAFGSVAAAEERYYESQRVLWLDHLRQDVRAAARSVVRYPVAALVAVVSLAFGIGAMTTTLMVRDTVFRKPPRLYARPADLSLVHVGRPDRPTIYPYEPSCPGTLYTAWRDAEIPGVAIAAAAPARVREVRTGDRTENLAVRPATANLFEVLGVAASVGRAFTDASVTPGARPAVLSRRLWQTLFDERPEAIGSPIWIDGEPYTIAGIMPDGFWFAAMGAAIWTPLDRGRLTADDMLLVVARRRAGMSPAALVAALQPALDAHVKPLPPAERQRRLSTRGVEGTPMGASMALLLPYVLGASVALTLLIACANVAILMIAQWSAREHEIAIRAALGAHRARIVRALVTESVLLAAAGGALGVAVTFALRGILLHRTQADGGAFNLAVDPRVLVQSAAITLASGILAGIAPALYETRRLHTNPLNTLAVSDRVRQRWRHALVVTEITITVALLVETGAMIGGYRRTLSADMGFERRPMLSAQIENRGGIAVAPLLETVTAMPGVAAAAAASSVPFMGAGARLRVAVEATPADDVESEEISVTRGFFSALGVPLREGRDFTASESGAARVAIVNEALARRLFAGRARAGSRIVARGTAYEIVGIAGDYATDQFQERTTAAKLFVPLAVDAAASMKQVRIVVRASADPAPLVQALRRQVRAAAAGSVVGGAFTYDQIAEVAGQELLVGTAPLVPLITIGMLLTTAGIYGVLAFAIARRARELAVRVAIGATGGDLVRLVAGHSLRLVVAGVALGVGATFALSRVVRASGGAGIYDPDWPAFAAPVAIVFVIGALATWIPSRRAMRIDPAVILRAS